MGPFDPSPTAPRTTLAALAVLIVGATLLLSCTNNHAEPGTGVTDAGPTPSPWSAPSQEGLQTRLVQVTRIPEIGKPVLVQMEVRHKDGKDWAQNTIVMSYPADMVVRTPLGEVVHRFPVQLPFRTHVPAGEGISVGVFAVGEQPAPLKAGTYTVTIEPRTSPELISKGMVQLPVAGPLTFTIPPRPEASGRAAAEWPAWQRNLLAGNMMKGPLSTRVRVRTEAATWDQLRETLRPDITFGEPGTANDDPRVGRDMLWFEEAADGSPVFRLDRAFIWQPDDLPARWVVLDFAGEQNDAIYRNHFSSHSLPARLQVTATPPDGDHPSSYAVVKSTDANGGTVYELGWAPEIASGTSLTESLRLLYVWRNATGRWHLLGEGPGSSRGHMGGFSVASDSTTVTVSWEGSPRRPVVVFVTASSTGVTQVEEEDMLHLTERTTCRQSALRTSADAWPVRLEYSPETYLVAEPGDTLARLIDRNLGLTWWEGKDRAARAVEVDHARQAFRQQILRLNPYLPETDLPAGTHVIVSRETKPAASP